MILLIDKPAGITSHDVVDRIRRIKKTRRVGHAGTLDPFATGLLLIGTDESTKELTAFVGVDKTYEATMRLGATSTTDDPEGEITERQIVDSQRPTPQQINEVLASFLGTSEQVTPLYSAKKINGKKMYELARQGLGNTVERPIKTITIHAIKMRTYAWPTLTFEVNVSSGTYIRALARDIGERLGTGAYLTALRRTRVGTFDIQNAKKLADF